MENKEPRIRGVNLGGWLMMEGYILHGRNIAESTYKADFEKANGRKALADFECSFRDNFITEVDFRNLSSLGVNAVRVPFNHKLIEIGPNKYNENGLSYLDKVFVWGKKNKIKIILDLHAAPGAQNCDWHGDCDTRALFWEKIQYRQRALRIWEMLADRYKDEAALLGYDVLNEPVLGNSSEKILFDFYKQAIKTIKGIDSRHTIYLEGSIWSQKIDFLAGLIEENVAMSIHFYRPLNYSFNFTPYFSFPGVIDNERWDEKTIFRSLKDYYDFSRKNNVPIFVGEFGINWRGDNYGELRWLDCVLRAFEDFGFDYTYWTYKAVANGLFPDGLYQNIPNSDFIKREGPIFGWENYIGMWKKRKAEIIKSWSTDNYKPNMEILGTLKKYFRKFERK